MSIKLYTLGFLSSLHILAKKIFKVSATFYSVVTRKLLSISVILLWTVVFSERKGLAVFQNFIVYNIVFANIPVKSSFSFSQEWYTVILLLCIKFMFSSLSFLKKWFLTLPWLLLSPYLFIDIGFLAMFLSFKWYGD